MHNSMLFFEAQRSGNIGNNGRVFWRSRAHLSDGADCQLSSGALSGGYYVGAFKIKILNFLQEIVAISSVLFMLKVKKTKLYYDCR